MPVVDLVTTAPAAVRSMAPSSEGVSSEPPGFDQALADAQAVDAGDQDGSPSDSTASVPRWGSSREARGDARLAMWLASTRVAPQSVVGAEGPDLLDTAQAASKGRGEAAASSADAEAEAAIADSAIGADAAAITLSVSAPVAVPAHSIWPLSLVAEPSLHSSSLEPALHPNPTNTPAEALEPAIQRASPTVGEVIEGDAAWIPRATTPDTASAQPIDPGLRLDIARHAGQLHAIRQSEGPETQRPTDQAGESHSPLPDLETRTPVQAADGSLRIGEHTHADASVPLVVDQDPAGQGRTGQGRPDVSHMSAAARSAFTRLSARVSPSIATTGSSFMTPATGESMGLTTAPFPRRSSTDHVDSADAMVAKRSRDAHGSSIGLLPTLVALPVTPLTNPAMTVAAPTAVGALEGAVGEDLRDQIVQGLRVQWHGTHGDARIRLQPQYLGELTVSLRVEQGAVSAQLAASSPEVRQWIEANEALLRQGLAQQDLRLERLVVAKDEPPTSPKRDQEADPRDREEPKRRSRRSRTDATFEVVV